MTNKKNVAEFRRKYRLKVVSSASLREILVTQGYTVVEFNGIDEKEEVASLIDALHLQDYISHSRGFAYQNDKYRIIFIHEDLNEEERCIVLAHEEGHIWNGHMVQNSVFGTDVVQEYEANEFAHHLLHDRNGNKKRIKILSILCGLIIAVAISTGVVLKEKQNAMIYTENLYRTDTGEKYHLKNCMYIRDKKNIHRLTKEEFDSEEYEPCGACLPGE